MQLPLIKDGVVVNVVEFEAGTVCCNKAELKEMQAVENANYEARAAEWRGVIQRQKDELIAAETQLEAAMAVAGHARRKAESMRDAGNSDQALKHVLTTGAEVDAWRENVAALRSRPLPTRPTLFRPVRWIVPEGHEIGAPGGNIGDTWDGKAYISPVVPAETVEAEIKKA